MHPRLPSSGPHMLASVSITACLNSNSQLMSIVVPTVLVETLGAALYSGTEGNAAWKQAYAEFGVGGPLKMALEPAGGFGKFLLVLAALSSIPVCLSHSYQDYF